MSATITSVAKLAGVSVATVSRVINSPDCVREETRARVLGAMRQLRFVPNELGRQLRGGTSALVGVLLPTLVNPVFAECAQGIEEAAAADGYRMLMTTCGYNRAAELAAVETFLRQRVNGIILTVAESVSSEALALLEHHGRPYVLAYNQTAERPSVSVDNQEAAFRAVGALLEKGHSGVAMLSGHLTASDRARQRHAGYLAAMRAWGKRPREVIEIDFESSTLPPGLIESLTTESPPVSAVFCGNDRLALIFIKSAWLAGFRVPEDFSVIGFDGLEVGEFLDPVLSSVVQPNRTIGRTCWSILTEVMQGQRPQSVILPHEIRSGGTILPYTPQARR